MILYLDSSALVKRYIAEEESASVENAIALANVHCTAAITQAEVVAALSRAIRVGKLTLPAAQGALRSFRLQWRDFVRLPVSDQVCDLAADYAWQFGLRGYDAVHLAAARAWADAMGSPVTFATFDRGLWDAAPRVGLNTYPDRSSAPGLWNSPAGSSVTLQDMLAEVTGQNLHGEVGSGPAAGCEVW
jgi:predicted nucleic acid-binding protein